jgi:hypothetical protein
MWTLFHYEYRDAGNYKARGAIALAGKVTAKQRSAIEACLDSGEFFIAEQVGIPSLRESLYVWGGGPSVDDHCWHRFVGWEEVQALPEEGLEICNTAEFVRQLTVDFWDDATFAL